jgi:hypothetical protein
MYSKKNDPWKDSTQKGSAYIALVILIIVTTIAVICLGPKGALEYLF